MDPQRFLDAQATTIDDALAELRAGRKRSHWMWFVFPQVAGLGRSTTAQYYALDSVDDARAYLAHPVLGERLRSCTCAALAHAGTSAHAVFGSPDDLKFRSCMTLFALAAADEPLFRRALDAFFGGVPDERTVAACRRRLGDGAEPA
jgi:uncharacterized protein (DUF1810 family)